MGDVGGEAILVWGSFEVHPACVRWGRAIEVLVSSCLLVQHIVQGIALLAHVSFLGCVLLRKSKRALGPVPLSNPIAEVHVVPTCATS